jgi:hypothetical protein
MFGDPVEATVTGTVAVLPTPNRAAWTARTVTVAAPGAAQQGPGVPIPDGFTVAVVFRATQTGAPKGYMANSAANTGLAASRTEMNKGDVRRLGVTNMNLLFFDADTAGAVFELVAEQ